VVIAGGDLSPLRELMECGIGVMYIAPDEALLRLALEAGVRYLICEGYEAGGHVGSIARSPLLKCCWISSGARHPCSRTVA